MRVTKACSVGSAHALTSGAGVGQVDSGHVLVLLVIPRDGSVAPALEAAVENERAALQLPRARDLVLVQVSRLVRKVAVFQRALLEALERAVLPLAQVAAHDGAPLAVREVPDFLPNEAQKGRVAVGVGGGLEVQVREGF